MFFLDFFHLFLESYVVPDAHMLKPWKEAWFYQKNCI